MILAPSSPFKGGLHLRGGRILQQWGSLQTLLCANVMRPFVEITAIIVVDGCNNARSLSPSLGQLARSNRAMEL